MTLPGEALIEAGMTPMHPGEFFDWRFLQSGRFSISQAAAEMDVDESDLQAFTERRIIPGQLTADSWGFPRASMCDSIPL
jgi:plasmid maintenance system antidote protein VapI